MARDLKYIVLQDLGREGEAETHIEAACKKMGKPKADFSVLLEKKEVW